MNKTLIVGNWKMNGSMQSINELLTDIFLDLPTFPDKEIAVCPPFVYLRDVITFLANQQSKMSLVAQDVSASDNGPCTGQVSAAMLLDCGCKYVLVGHSERRIAGESDELCANKFFAGSVAGLIPIFCVGESREEYSSGKTREVVTRQLNSILLDPRLGSVNNFVLAYEPVWAIGTGLTATPQQAQEIHQFIREIIGEFRQNSDGKVSILYGGSVKPSNAAKLLSMPDINGLLIGGASLQADEFLLICGV